MAWTLPTKFIEIAGVALMIIVWGVIALTFSKSPMPALSAQAPEMISPETSVDFVKSLPGFDVYAAQLDRRDLFGCGIKTAGIPENNINLPTGQLPAHLKVVGIILGEDPEVVIEDSQVNQVFFITKGRPQAGIEIQKVEAGKVVIVYQGQSIDLPLNKGKAESSGAVPPGFQNNIGQNNVPFPFINQ